jgi:hypothetical protein
MAITNYVKIEQADNTIDKFYVYQSEILIYTNIGVNSKGFVRLRSFAFAGFETFYRVPFGDIENVLLNDIYSAVRKYKLLFDKATSSTKNSFDVAICSANHTIPYITIYYPARIESDYTYPFPIQTHYSDGDRSAFTITIGVKVRSVKLVDYDSDYFEKIIWAEIAANGWT